MFRTFRAFSAALLGGFAALVAASYRTDFPLPTMGANDGLGVNVALFGPPSFNYASMRAIGIRWVRTSFEWRGIEQQRGTYNWGGYETFLDQCRANRIRPIIVLGYGHPLYTGGPKQGPTTPAGRAAFAAFARAAVAKFKGRGVVWEIWNEPNYEPFWQNPDPAAYMALVDESVAAIRAEASQEWVIAPGLAGLDLAFLKGCLDRGLLSKVDGISFHPYRFTPPETVALDLAELRGLISRYPGGATVPLVNTEWGYAIGQNATDQFDQRSLLLRLVGISLASQLPFNSIFAWRDMPPTPNDIGIYGLLGPGDRPRAAYFGLRNIGLQLAGFRYAGRLFTGDDRDYALLFTNGRQEKILAWSLRYGEVVLPTMPNVFVRQRFPQSLTAPALTDRVVRIENGLRLMLNPSPQLITLVGTDAGLRSIAGLPPLPLAQSVDGIPSLRNHLRTWGRYVRPLPRGATLTISDGPTEAGDGRGATQRIDSEANPSANVGVDEADALLARLPSTSNREGVRRRLVYTLGVPGRPALTFESILVPAKPISGGMLPDDGTRTATYRFRNPLGTDFSGVIEYLRPEYWSAPATGPVTVAANQPLVDVDVPASDQFLLQGGTIRIRTGGRDVFSPIWLRPLATLGLGGLPLGSVAPHFNLVDSAGLSAGAAGAARIIASPPGLPARFSRSAEVTYNLPTNKGGLLLAASSPTTLLKVYQPREIVAWVYGDGSGNGLCATFSDEQRGYFMTKRVPLDFVGWREVRWRTRVPTDFHVARTSSTNGLPSGWCDLNGPFFLVVDGNPVRRGTIAFGGLTVFGTPNASNQYP